MVSGNARAAHFAPEPFATAAALELDAFPLSPPGVCRNPLCSKVFAPTRPWQHYCCAACKTVGDAEFRLMGQRAAPALLAWQIGRYATSGTPQQLLSRAGRRYFGSLASGWLRDRRAREVMAVEGRG